jgi:electron transfer flavoprotein alpha subunit
MSKSIIFCEVVNGKMKRSSLELLTAARKLSLKPAAVLFGASVGSAASDASAHGADEIHLIKDAELDQYNPELYVANLAALVEKLGAKVILASAGSLAKDMLPRLAARLSAGIVSDCIEVSSNGGQLIVKKPVYSGKAFATISLDSSSVQIILMRANQLPVEAASGAGSITEHTKTSVSLNTLLQEVVRGASEKLDLTEANVIVSGGRGLKEANNFKMLHDLADVLGATVGASRAVVDAGWVGHGMQVGQTGKTVAPSLYIAVGISGAIQHLAGMSGSKVIVAINSDPNAPIFQKATYGIVGDAFEIVPKLTEEFKKALGKQ